MKPDQAHSCENLRDVAEFVNLIAGQELLPTRRLLRGGLIDYVRSADDLLNPATIINLRVTHDANTFGAGYCHCPAPNDQERYVTTSPEVRRWLTEVIGLFELPDLAYPVMIHCRSGKDRTGIVVGSLLRILGIPDEIIIEEYLLSEGKLYKDLFLGSLAGIGDPAAYFKGINLAVVAANLRGIAR
jgi:protein-tyrosine phosphatase